MHELAVTKDILRTVVRSAEANGARRIVTIRLTVGALREIVQEWMQRYFDYVSKGTLAEGARIVIATCPVTVRCQQCDRVYPADITSAQPLACPGCGGAQGSIETGRELRIDGIEVV